MKRTKIGILSEQCQLYRTPDDVGVDKITSKRKKMYIKMNCFIIQKQDDGIN